MLLCPEETKDRPSGPPLRRSSLQERALPPGCTCALPRRQKRLSKFSSPYGPWLAAGLFLLWMTSGCSAQDLPSPPRSTTWGTTERDGVFWLVDPQGRLFYSKGVNSTNGGKDSPKSRDRQAYFWRNFYPSLEAWRQAVGGELLGWGFNTLGGWSDPSPQFPLALTVNLELGRNAKFHWFDPLDPAMEQAVLEWAERLTAPFSSEPRLIGYFTDNEVGWWNSPLFEWYLSKGWENHTKRALWHMLDTQYGGKWDRLLEDWVPDEGLKSFEDLKASQAKLRLRPGGRGILLVNRFMNLCARRYYELTSGAIRKVHPKALVLGDRLPLYYHQDAVLAMRDYVDVISTNYNVDVPDGWVAPYYFEGLQRLARRPVLVTEFFFAAEENRSGNRNETARNEYPDAGHLMTVATQAERARGAAKALVNFARFPNVVGTHWFQHTDEPLGGRDDGEDYNMGLVDNANRPYEQLIEVFKNLNPQFETLHGQARKPESITDARQTQTTDPAGGGDPATSISRARRPIDLSDQSLVDWDKEESRLDGFHAPEPYAPFGDVHLSWRPEGLFLACLANTYVNPGFLAYRGEFPLEECFQLHLWAELEGSLHHFSVYLQPEKNSRFRDGFEVKTLLCRLDEPGHIERLPIVGRVQRIDKTLPHMVFEAFLPSQWLGVERLWPGTRIRMNVVVESFFREITMSWRGEPPECVGEFDEFAPGLQDVVLQD